MAASRKETKLPSSETYTLFSPSGIELLERIFKGKVSDTIMSDGKVVLTFKATEEEDAKQAAAREQENHRRTDATREYEEAIHE